MMEQLVTASKVTADIFAIGMDTSNFLDIGSINAAGIKGGDAASLAYITLKSGNIVT